MAAPHLSGNLVMRFLDPDESALRVLAGANPFVSWSAAARDGGGEGGEGDANRGGGQGSRRSGGSGDANANGNPVAAAALKEETAEREDFDTLTESLGGFG